MARPNKFSKENADRILGLMAKGYCLKDVAAMAGVSDITIMRCQPKDPAFNKAFLEATACQWENINRSRERGPHSCRRSGYIAQYQKYLQKSGYFRLSWSRFWSNCKKALSKRALFLLPKSVWPLLFYGGSDRIPSFAGAKSGDRAFPRK